MNDNTLGWRAQIIMGVAMALALSTAVRVDYINNVAYGASISPEAATVLGMSAIMVAAIPAAAGVLGWCWLLRAGIAVFLTLTVWSAHIAYDSKQGETVRQSQTRQENYIKAKEKETRAKEVLKLVKETGSQDELGNLAAKADANLAEAETALPKVCKSRPDVERCKEPGEARKKADAEAKLAHERVSQAKARDKAEVDLAEAEQRSATGPAQKREETPLLTWMFILATQIAALLGEKAMRLITGGWHARPQKTAPKPKRTAAPVPPTGGTREPLPANVVPLRKHSVEAWLASAAAPGGELKGGEALKAYRRWPEADAQMTAGELRSILTRIYGDALEARTSGYVVHGVSLRTMAASQAKAAAC